MSKCKVCGNKCEGNLTIIQDLGEGKGLEVDACDECFRLWTLGDWEELSKRAKINTRKWEWKTE